MLLGTAPSLAAKGLPCPKAAVMGSAVVLKTPPVASREKPKPSMILDLVHYGNSFPHKSWHKLPAKSMKVQQRPNRLLYLVLGTGAKRCAGVRGQETKVRDAWNSRGLLYTLQVLLPTRQRNSNWSFSAAINASTSIRGSTATRVLAKMTDWCCSKWHRLRRLVM